MDEQFDELVAKLQEIIGNFGTYADDPAALQETLGADTLTDVSQEQYRQALEQVMEEYGIPEDVQEQVFDQLEAQDDYSATGLQQHVNLVINYAPVTNNIDQGLDIHGEVHGDVIQENQSNVANAVGEGAIAGEYVEGNQVQTGDGQQVGGNSGVQNQGDNSGQQAGGSAIADNVTTGDGNTIGSGEASRIGEGQVSQDYASIDDSAQAFGEGAATNTANDTADSHDTFEVSSATADSFNTSDYDANEVTQTINADGHGGGYEPPVYVTDDYKVDDYKADDYKADDYKADYKVDDYKVDVPDYKVDEPHGYGEAEID